MHPFHFSFVVHFAVLAFAGNGARVQDVSAKRHLELVGFPLDPLPRLLPPLWPPLPLLVLDLPSWCA